MKSTLINYLSSVYSSQQKLVDGQDCLTPTTNKRYCDIPHDMSAEELAAFNQALLEMGYTGLHIGLTSLWNKRNEQFVSEIKKIGFGAAHGTSVKWQLRTGSDYSAAVRYDKRIIDELDPSGTVPLNYDLFAGNVGQSLSNDMVKEHDRNAILLANALHLKSEARQEAFAVMSYIVKTVREVFKNSKRTIVFEVPGTLGFSMFPNPNQFKRLRTLVASQLPNALFCIDVGHLLTWQNATMSTDQLIQSLEPLRGVIGMMHISSAGSRNKYFNTAYKIAFGQNTPDWHIDGLDLMLAVHEEEMLPLVAAVRTMQTTTGLIEVCETRKPSAGIADYFNEMYKGSFDDSPYITSLKLQAQLLGYRPSL